MPRGCCGPGRHVGFAASGWLGRGARNILTVGSALFKKCELLYGCIVRLGDTVARVCPSVEAYDVLAMVAAKLGNTAVVRTGNTEGHLDLLAVV